ncbi:LOB domain-containing protein 27-like protein [Cinnamomum micranthum f. kanehirae]|uniref:LOB domain-containing protein 27-like protein n=1 Tax=Cinnamomum micranthum f. kanehirae TaxID=337451 RepID=A0A443N266_9MAGN|nr:LOB domain-containing protein 27-like protein [Cinnamomum micranthum f. kanehirae]
MMRQACAACKYQRRECTADCRLAPYFPHDQPQHFKNVHRLFGVMNILKILAQLHPSQKRKAIRSIKYEAKIRNRYPIHGCLGIIRTLQAHIHQSQQQLDEVNAQLSIYREQHHQISPLPSSQCSMTYGGKPQKMTVKGGSSQACAACKYQRRKCNTDCPLAPYFPADQRKQFENAHRLFGVSNIIKILKQLDTSQKMDAMQSIVCQANIREKYPVHGCLGIICGLQVVIHRTQQELDAVNAQLAICREQHHQISLSSSSSPFLPIAACARIGEQFSYSLPKPLSKSTIQCRRCHRSFYRDTPSFLE